jgi:hypothetical protein
MICIKKIRIKLKIEIKIFLKKNSKSNATDKNYRKLHC